jgi:hypothetical protein
MRGSTLSNKRGGGGKYAKLLNVEVGINVEGAQICQITKRGGWNKRGGWDFVEKTNA